MDFRFRWTDRLHRSCEFSAVIQQGHRYGYKGLILWAYRRSDTGARGARLGLAIPRTFGNAVQRNRLKRLLREVFRLNKYRLPVDVDLVFSARPMTGLLRYPVVEPLVMELWKKAGLLTLSLSEPL